MAATTTTRQKGLRSPADLFEYPIAAATKIPKGAHVCYDPATGMAKNAVDGAGLIYVGWAEAEYDNSSGSAGDINGRFICEGVDEHMVKIGAIVAANVGTKVCIVDNQTIALFGDAVNAPNQVVCGHLTALNGNLLEFKLAFAGGV